MSINATNPVTTEAKPAIPARTYNLDWMKGIYMQAPLIEQPEKAIVRIETTRYLKDKSGTIEVLPGGDRSFDTPTMEQLKREMPDMADDIDLWGRLSVKIAAAYMQRKVYPIENLQANPRLRNG